MAMFSYRKPAMHKVSPLLRNLERSDKIYDPLVVSFGPYHYGKPELQDAEHYKSTAVQLFVSGSQRSLEFFKNKILEIIYDVRSCYVEGSTNDFSDSELAEMMLRDASFLLNYIELNSGSDYSRMQQIWYSIVNNLDRLAITLTLRDLFLLENQIPYSVIILLIYLRYEKSEGEEMLNKFISGTVFDDKIKRMKFSVDEQQPAHLLDAFRQVLVAECTDNNNQQSNSCFSSLFKAKDEDRYLPNVTRFRSSTDLSAKGIRFKPSNSYSLMDINFNSFCFQAELQLPYWFISVYTKVFFSNMIAYENCLEGRSSAVVTAYVSFMKVLIQNAEDVKLLRERKVISNNLGTDEEALQVFNELDRFDVGTDNWVFDEVRKEINQHCNSKAETWMGELVHTYFRSPWTALALIAAIFLLCLGFIQAYFSVNPA